MKKRALLISLVLPISLILISFVCALTINVDTNDLACVSGTHQSDPYSVVYCNIQDAIDDASDSDTIEVASGTYTPVDLSWDGYGFLRINKPITLKGAGSANTIIDGQHLYTVTRSGTTCTVDTNCISGKEICNQDTHKCQEPHSTCLWLESSNVNLESLTIKGCDWGIRVSNIYVPTVTEISDLTFNDVTVTDNYGHGIVFENIISKRVEFTDCNANANGDRGIYLNQGSIAEDFTLTNTNANDNWAKGFNCQGTLNRLTINGGTFNNNTGGWNYEHVWNLFGAGLD